VVVRLLPQTGGRNDESVDLQAEGTLHERDDGGSEMQYNFSVVQKGPIAELLRSVVAMTAEQRARLVLDVPGGDRLTSAKCWRWRNGRLVMTAPRTIADFTAKLPNGEEINLADKLGAVLLVVNTASKCGFTPQYDGLEALWRKYREQGFEILAFPCNQFGGQEPGTAEEIESFCKVNFGVSFPLMAKIDVNGDDATPLYQWLKAEAPGVLGTRGSSGTSPSSSSTARARWCAAMPPPTSRKRWKRTSKRCFRRLYRLRTLGAQSPPLRLTPPAATASLPPASGRGRG
jgi:glutathione peroxidase